MEKNEDSFENPQWDHVNKTPVRHQDYKCPQHMEAYLILNDSVFYLQKAVFIFLYFRIAKNHLELSLANIDKSYFGWKSSFLLLVKNFLWKEVSRKSLDFVPGSDGTVWEERPQEVLDLIASAPTNLCMSTFTQGWHSYHSGMCVSSEVSFCFSTLDTPLQTT